jgi:hypothetical protein
LLTLREHGSLGNRLQLDLRRLLTIEVERRKN